MGNSCCQADIKNSNFQSNTVNELNSSEENILEDEMNSSNFPADDNNISVLQNQDGDHFSITLNKNSVNSFLQMNSTLTTYEKAKLFDRLAKRMKQNKSVDLDIVSLSDNLSIWPTENNFEANGQANNKEFG